MAAVEVSSAASPLPKNDSVTETQVEKTEAAQSQPATEKPEEAPSVEKPSSEDSKDVVAEKSEPKEEDASEAVPEAEKKEVEAEVEKTEAAAEQKEEEGAAEAPAVAAVVPVEESSEDAVKAEADGEKGKESSTEEVQVEKAEE